VKPGKTLTFCEARAFVEDGTAEPRLMASMAATLMAIYDRRASHTILIRSD
jgi:hypothetical protein